MVAQTLASISRESGSQAWPEASGIRQAKQFYALFKIQLIIAIIHIVSYTAIKILRKIYIML